MPVKFTNGIDLDQESIINAVVHPVASDPSTPEDGQIWYRTDTDRLMVRMNGVSQQVASMSDLTGGAITGALWDAQSYVKAISDDTPIVQVVGNGEFVGRALGQDIGVVTAAQARAIVNVEDGSTADQTPAEILAALLTVDGSGSGLDADLFDGVDSTLYALKTYVDSATQGLSPKDSVRAASIGNLTLSGTQTVDGVSLIADDRIIVKDQSTASENGIYVVAAGAWSRSTDADTEADILGAMAFVSEGTTNADTVWLMTTDAPITVGSTSLSWTQFGAGAAYTAGAGLTLAANEFSIAAGDVTDAMLASTFPKKAVADIGNGAATAIAFVHNLGNKDVVWSIRDNGDDSYVLPDLVSTSTTTLTFTFGTAPTTNQYRVVAVG